MVITILQYVMIGILIACFLAIPVCFIGMAKCNNDLFYNRHGGRLLNKLKLKNEMISTTQSWELLTQIQIKSNAVYLLADVKWLLQEATENEFLDNLPEEPEKQFVYLNFSNHEMYKVLYTASKMFGDDCLKYGADDTHSVSGIGISFEHAIHAYESM